MSYPGEAAEQVVKMSLETTEVAVKLAGAGAKELAVLLYAILKDQKKTKGKTRIVNLLKSGKELKVFAVKDDDLIRFCKEAKKYGVLYTILKDRDATDGSTDIMVRAEDASKINRIFEKFNLATVDMASVQANIENDRAQADANIPEPEREKSAEDKTEAFLDELFSDNPTLEKGQTENPTDGRIAKSHQSEPSSDKQHKRDKSEREQAAARPSVKKELAEIKKELAQKESNYQKQNVKDNPKEHQPPKKKRKEVNQHDHRG